MVLPSQGGNNELEKMIKKVTGRKKYKDRKPIFNILDIIYLLAFIAVPVIYNINHEIMIIHPFVAWMFILSFFCFTITVEAHMERFKAQRIGFFIMGIATLIPALGILLLNNL